jgi:hypothetical protein
MKLFKLAIIALALFISTNSFAQYFGLPMIVGIHGGLSSWAYAEQVEGDDYSYTHSRATSYYNIGLFFDAKYARISLDYVKNSGDTTYETEFEYTGTSETYTDSYDQEQTYVDFTALLKYPFSNCCTNMDIWPSFGLAYTKCLTANYSNGEEFTYKDNLDDLWLQFGLGIDFRLTEVVIATTDFQAGICLTPDIYDDYSDNDEDLQSNAYVRLQWNVGIGYRFGGGGY